MNARKKNVNEEYLSAIEGTAVRESAYLHSPLLLLLTPGVAMRVLHRLGSVLAALTLLLVAVPAAAEQVNPVAYESMTKADLLEVLAAKPKAELIRLLTVQQAAPEGAPSNASPSRASHIHMPSPFVLMAGTALAGFAVSALTNRHTAGASVMSSGPGTLQTAAFSRHVLDTTTTAPSATCNTAVSFSNCTAYPLHQVTCNVFAGVTSASSLTALGIDTNPNVSNVTGSGADQTVTVKQADLNRAGSQKYTGVIIGLALHIAQIAANCTNGQPASQ